MKIFSNTLFVLLFITIWSTLLSTAKAHELKTDGSISVLLHINPDDDPIAGQLSELLFLTQDKEKRFNTENCDCYASVSYNNETMFTSPLFKANSSYRGIFAPAIPYTFPQKGIYTVRLTGEPKNISGFQSFSISYDVRIEKDAKSPIKPRSNNTLYYFVVIATLAGVAYFIKLFFSKPNTD